jgi:Fe-S-cluster containining protein
VSLVKKYNILMKNGIDGPDCTDSKICRGDCCSIFIDVPKALANELINIGLASECDFVRGDIFAFQLRIDDKTGKCVFFDKSINGCRLHNSSLKPPACWIYPTNFESKENEIIECKKASGWRIIDREGVKRAKQLLQQFVKWSETEFKEEMSAIQERVESKVNEESLVERIQKLKPSEFAGFRDAWNHFEALKAEGISLQLKKFCLKYNPNCALLPDNFLECKNICGVVSKKTVEFLKNKLEKYLKKFGPDSGEYPLIKISEFFTD